MILDPMFLSGGGRGRNPSFLSLLLAPPNTTCPSDWTQMVQKNWQTEGAKPASGELSLD